MQTKTTTTLQQSRPPSSYSIMSSKAGLRTAVAHCSVIVYRYVSVSLALFFFLLYLILFLLLRLESQRDDMRVSFVLPIIFLSSGISDAYIPGDDGNVAKVCGSNIPQNIHLPR